MVIKKVHGGGGGGGGLQRIRNIKLIVSKCFRDGFETTFFRYELSVTYTTSFVFKLITAVKNALKYRYLSARYGYLSK